jgi:hypothetical protein
VIGNTDIRSHRQMQLRGTQYIHVEELESGSSTTTVQAGSGWLGAILLLSALGGAIYYNHQ